MRLRYGQIRGYETGKGGIMAKRRRSVGLIAFLKGSSDPKEQMPGCANYDHYYGGCLFADACLVEQGNRCGYFEKAVLPIAYELGLQNVYDAYEEQCGISGDGMLNRSSARVCPDCGGPIRPRQRYCDDCSRKRRRATYRRSRKKKVGWRATLKKNRYQNSAL